MKLKNTFLAIAVMALSLTLQACGEVPNVAHIDEASSIPAAPKSIQVVTPKAFPSRDNTPTLRISGVKSGQTVYVYKSSACTTTLKSAKAKSSSIDITLSALPNGNYKFYTRSGTSAGKSKCKGYAAYTVDRAAPQNPTITSPIDSAIVGASPVLEGTCETGSSITVSGDIAPSPITATCAGGLFDTPINLSGADGIKNLSVKSTDKAGNYSSVSHSLVLDTEVPTVTLDELIVINASNEDAYSISGSCTDDGDTITLVAPAAVSGNTTTCSSGTFTFSNLDVQGIPDGTVNFDVSIADVLGNSTTDSESATKDVAAPTISTLTLSSPATSPGNDTTPDVLVSGTFPIGDTFRLYTDMTCTTQISSSVVASSANSITLTTTALTENSYTFFARGSDEAGNVVCEGVQSVSYILDTTAPTVTITTPMTVINNTNKTSYDFSGTCNDDTASVSITAPAGFVGTVPCSAGTFSFTGKNISAQSDGSVTFTVRIQDTAGNFSTHSASATKDTVNPTIAINALATITQSNQTNYSINGTCSANGDVVTITTPVIAGTATCTAGAFSFTGKNVSGMSDSNTASFTLRNTDAAGNFATATRTTIKDTVIPTSPACGAFSGNATPTKSDTLDWTGSTDATSGINHYEMSIGLSAEDDIVGWTNIGSGVTPYRFTGISPKLLFKTGYSTFIRAVDNVGLVSSTVQCSSWTVKPGYGNFRGTENNYKINPHILNQADAHALQYSEHQYNPEYMSHGENSETITILENGDYLLSHILPLDRLNGNDTAKVASAISTVTVNDSAVSTGVAANSFTRGKEPTSNPTNSSNNMTILLENLKEGDVITVTSQNNATSDEPLTVAHHGYFSTYLEYIPEEDSIVSATSTETTVGSNLNQSDTTPYMWSGSIVDSDYKLTGDGVIVGKGGDFLISVNVPFRGDTANQKIEAHIYVDGSDMNYHSYTVASNGYVSNIDEHIISSTNYTNVLKDVPDGAFIQITTKQLGEAGEVNVINRTQAALFIQRLNTESKYFISTGDSPSNWNTDNILTWSDVHMIDTKIYNHNPGESEIIVNYEGDYIAYFSDRLSSPFDLVKPITRIKINGENYPSAICSSHNMRESPETNRTANCDMQVMLHLNRDDKISISTELDILSGDVTGDLPRLTLRKVSE